MTKKLLRIEEITFTLNEDESLLKQKILKILWILEKDLLSFEIVKKAIDSRKKQNILFVYSVNLDLWDNEKYLSQKHNFKIQENIKRHKIRLIEPFVYEVKEIDKTKLKKRPIVIWTWPSWLFAWLLLALAWANPIIFERWSKVEKRVIDVHNFFTKWVLDLHSNVQFWEWWAWTFSDWKLYTLVNDPRSKFIFSEFVKAWAPEEIIYSARPHIWTDRLRWVVRNMRKKIISLGWEIHFDTMITDLEIEDNHIKSVITQTWEKYETDDLIFWIWHSWRETYEMMYNKWFQISQKPFAIWVRVEHPREFINKAQFWESCTHSKLPTANYKLVSHNENTRSTYTFCMCPGGEVVNASSEEWKLCVNWMSYYAQNSINSNSALLVNVMPSDFWSDHPLAWLDFQRKLERDAFIAWWSDFSAPAQLIWDFLNDVPSTNLRSVDTTFKPKLKMTSLRECLPDFVIEWIKEWIRDFDKKIPWFANPDAILIWTEARTSAVLRFFRDENCESNIKWAYPTWEWAWYAWWITSSSIDWLIVAENVIKKYL